MSTGAESEGLTGFRIDFVRRGLPSHGFIIEQSLEKESANCGRWKAGVRVLPILLIPIEKDAGWYIQGQLIALFQRAPAVLVGLGIQGYLSFRGMSDIVKENEMSRLIELFGANAVLYDGKADICYWKPCLF